MNELQLLQNKAVKIVLSLPRFYSSTEALKELRWPTLSKHRLFHHCVFVYKYVNSIIDFKFDTKLIVTSIPIILLANPIFTYRELGAIMETAPSISRNSRMGQARQFNMWHEVNYYYYYFV